MVLMRTESTWYNTNNSLGEIINKFQDYNIKKKKNIEGFLKEKKIQNNKDSILSNQTSSYIYIYIYVVR